MSETIYIIGAGAVGKTLAVLLQSGGRNVIVLRGREKVGVDARVSMIIEWADGTELSQDILVSTLSSHEELDGLIVLTSKSFGNREMAQLLKERIRRSPLIILQNGLGIERPFIEEGLEEVYRCVLFMTAQEIAPGRVRFKPVASCPIGVVAGDGSKLEEIVRQLSTPEFLFRMESDILTITWKKAISNCVFNSVCPLLDIDNGIFHRNQQAMDIASGIVRECVKIANKSGIGLSEEEVLENILLISRSSDGQLISTLQDIQLGRETEIETLNFEVWRIARELGMENEVSGTRLIGEMVRLRSELSRE